MTKSLTLEAVRETAELIDQHICETPVVEWSGVEMSRCLPDGARLFAKLEMFQRSGTFKARGALSNVMRLTSEERARGVTAMSAGTDTVWFNDLARHSRQSGWVQSPRCGRSRLGTCSYI